MRPQRYSRQPERTTACRLPLVKSIKEGVLFPNHSFNYQ